MTRSSADYAALLLRVSMGVMFLAHGLLLKVLTFGPAGTAAYFESIGYPAVLAYAVILAEIAGGAMLIVGAYVRIVALALVPVLIGATVQHLSAGWVFSAQGGGWEFPAFWTVALLAQALLGAGAHAAVADELPAGLRARPA
jgi:putative oxidoreductase